LHRRHGAELHGFQRVGPACGIAEKVVQPLRFGGRIAAPGRLDPDLAAQRDRLHLLAAGLADPQHQRQGRHHRVPVHLGPDAVEGKLGHVRAPAPVLAPTPPPRARLARTPPPRARLARTPPPRARLALTPPPRALLALTPPPRPRAARGNAPGPRSRRRSAAPAPPTPRRTR